MSKTQLVPRKWRPPLSWVVLAVLVGVISLPVAVLIWLRFRDGGGFGMWEQGLVALTLLMVVVVAFVLARTLTGPITGLAKRADAIAEGGREALQPLEGYGTEETALLADRFYALATKLMDRNDYVSSLSTHVVHEFKSPLTSIKGAAELLRDDGKMSAKDRTAFLEQILADVDRLNVLTGKLRELGAAEASKGAGFTNLQVLVGQLRDACPGVDIQLTGGESLPLVPEAAHAVLTQLVSNARENGASCVSLVVQQSAGETVLDIADNGSGIAPEIAARIFEPFFTTRRETGGTGMGLHIVRAMLQANGGAIELVPGEKGAVFRIVVGG